MLARHVCVEKPNQRHWQDFGGSISDREDGCCEQHRSAVGRLRRRGAAATGLSPANKMLGRNNCSALCLPFEMLSLPVRKEICVERGWKKLGQSWKNVTEIPLQKDVLLAGCSGVTSMGSRRGGGRS